MPPTEGESLQRASAALDEADTAKARTALLSAWRAGRSAAVADLISLLDARQPDSLPAQLDAVITPRVATTEERFAALTRLDDPRVSAFAIAALERLPFTTPGAQPLLEAFITVIAQRKDVRLLPVARQIREGLRTRLTRAPVRDAVLSEFDDAVAVLGAFPSTTPAEVKALQERLAPLQAPAQSEDALLAAIHEHPAQDAPRLVYADWLLERGDPRGEFITLQFKRRAGPLSEAEGKREQQLLKKHGKAWLGALAPVLSFGKGYSGTTFERGFLCRADIILSVGKKLEPLWKAREWTTVEQLLGNWPLELLEKAPLTALRELNRTLTADTVSSLRRGRQQLGAETLEFSEEVRDWAEVRAVFPKLRTVAVWWAGTPSLAVLQHYGKLGLHRLELRRTWNAPRGPAVEAEFSALLEVLKTTLLPFAELALMPAWKVGGPRPGLVELRPTAGGFSVQ